MKKLNSKGLVHHIALILVVVGIAIGGMYYLVASKADTYGNPLSSKAVCENAHFNRTWVGTKRNGTCTKTCQAGLTHIVANPYDYCTKVTSPTATRNTSPVASKSNCQNAPYFRVWSNGKCTKSCQASHPVPVVASPYDYCKKASSTGSGNTGGTSNSYEQSGTSKITVNGRTSTGGQRLSFNLKKATRLNVHVYSGYWKLCNYTGVIDVQSSHPSGVSCRSLPKGISTWGASGSVYFTL